MVMQPEGWLLRRIADGGVCGGRGQSKPPEFQHCSLNVLARLIHPARVRVGEDTMVQRVSTVAFEGIEARAVDVQVQVAPGLPAFTKECTINRIFDMP